MPLPTPIALPPRPIVVASSKNIATMRPGPNPSARSTATSGVRSNTAIDIVFATPSTTTTVTIVTNTRRIH